MWKALSRAGCKESAEMEAVREGDVAWPGGSKGAGRVRRWV